VPPSLVTILYAALNCLRLATLGGLREQDRPTLSRTGYEPCIVPMAGSPSSEVSLPDVGTVLSEKTSSRARTRHLP
jgi:hypothetical protein